MVIPFRSPGSSWIWAEMERLYPHMLFIQAIDLLQRIVELAARRGTLKPVLLEALEMQACWQLYLSFFGKCSGLKINMDKTEIFPIRCHDTRLQDNIAHFLGKISSSLESTWGCHMHTRKLKKIEFQPLIEKIGGKTTWLERKVFH